MSECLFCRIVAGEIPADVVHQTDTVMAFRDIQPRARVHTLVIPKEHHRTVAQLAADDPGLLADVMAAAGEVARIEGVDESGYRLVSNVGRDAGQEVDHVHVHVLGGQPLGVVARPVD
ncbi:MAG TPA: histidine triad nucleotide-binding protein [Ornithinicoccus sp.]|nr:histidine triad nucleotide-binding protein [Ornithinicoccus sp.]